MNENNFNLINGEFSPEEAIKILCDVYASKIQYHEKRNLSILIKEQRVDQQSTNRIQNLKFQIDEIKRIISNTPSEEKLFISCEIRIESTKH
jgi:hypothetical protein